jgi:aminopeptidase
VDPRVQAMADVLVNYSVNTKPGDWVVIQSSLLGEPLAVACVQAVLRAGANPSVVFGSDEVQETFLREANDEQLHFISPLNRQVIEQANATIRILAPANTRTLSRADPRKMAAMNKAMEPLLETYMQRSASEDLMWTIGVYPTRAAAQDAGMSLRDYEEFVYRAGLLDESDPVAAWKQLGDRQDQMIDWLKGKKTVHITGPGTDLTVSFEGRTWLNDDGHKNFPGGEIFTGPVEDATEGYIQFTYPAFLAGREVPDVRLVFERGKVVDATAARDEGYLHQMLDMDEGARRLGEFAFGTNYGIQDFTKNTLFDEKIGGTLHMALGRAYPETGGTNLSALHWDMVYNLREGAEVTVDGELFSRNGEFMVGVPV